MNPSKAELLMRPIIGIENRTAQEVFDIMCDRFNSLPDEPAPRGYPFQEPGHIDFDAPSNEGEAAAMAILATNWLEKNAPHRLQSNRPAIVPAPSPTKPEGLEWGKDDRLLFNKRGIGSAYHDPNKGGDYAWDFLDNDGGREKSLEAAKTALFDAARSWLSPVSDADTVRVKRDDAEAILGFMIPFVSAYGGNPEGVTLKETADRLRASLNGEAL